MTSLLIAALLSLLRVGDVAYSISSTIPYFFILSESASPPVYSGVFTVFLLFKVAYTYIVRFFLDVDHFMSKFILAYPALENTIDRFLCDDVNAGCESDLSTTFPFSSIQVTCICGGCSRRILIALVTDFRSVANTRGKWSLWKRDFSSCDRLSRRL